MKMIIVMRKDLNMRKGKMCAQAGHAVLGAWTAALSLYDEVHYKKWFEDNLCTKICLAVNSEEELLDIYNKGIEANLIVHLVEDYGITEFKGKHTLTCLAFEPLDDEIIDSITGELSLL